MSTVNRRSLAGSNEYGIMDKALSFLLGMSQGCSRLESLKKLMKGEPVAKMVQMQWMRKKNLKGKKSFD